MPNSFMHHVTINGTNFEIEDKQARDDLNDLKSDLHAYINDILCCKPFVENSFVDHDGTIKSYKGWTRTGYLDVSKFYSITVKSSVVSSYNCFYDANQTFSSYFNVGTAESTIIIPQGVQYVIFSNTAEGMDNLTVTYVTKEDKALIDTENAVEYLGGRTEIIDGCKSIYPSDFCVGNIVISVSGWSYTDSDFRVSTRPDVTYHLNTGDVISLSSYSSARMYIGWRKDSDDTYAASGWKTSDFIVTEPGNYVINIDSVPNTAQSSVNNLFSLLSIKLANVDPLLSRVSELEKAEEIVVEDGTNLVYLADWKSINNSGIQITNLNLTATGVELTAINTGTYRSAYCDIDVTEANAVTISYDTITPSTAKVRYGKRIDTTTTWLGYVDGTAVVDTTDIDTLRVTLYINEGTSVDAGTTAVFTHLQIEFGSLKTPYTNLRYTAIDAKARGDLSSIVNEVTGTGNYAYYGDKITIDETTTGHLCNAELWKDFNSADITDIADYNFTEHQSMTVYNDFMFLFQAAGGACTILDMGTKDIVSTAVLTPTTNNHQNSAQFTDIYFEANDEFPLLAISRCGNSNTASGTTDPALDCVNFYRVQRSNAIFTFTLVNKAVFNKNTYGSSWGIDVNSKRLFVVYLSHGNWSVRTDNPLTYSVFPMPSKSAILSGETITYEETDEIGHYETDYMSFQAMIVHNGLAFTGVNNLDIPSISRNQLWIADVLKGRIKSKMPLLMFHGFEVEGVAIYSNSLFLTARSGGDASYPLKIWKYDF